MKLPFLLTLFFTVSVLADEPVPVSSNLPVILLPMTPVLVEPVEDTPTPLPVPKPKPSSVIIDKLPLNTWYFIESKVKLLVYDSPEGVVITKEYDLTERDNKSQTITILGAFADGNGQPDETRTYPSNSEYKFVYSIRAIKAGTPELLLLPAGATDKLSTLRQIIVVGGTGPIPPPVPTPTPVPDVSPTGLRVLLLYNENANRDQLNTVNSTEIVKWMTLNCVKTAGGTPEWRRWDRTSVARTGVVNETEVWQKLWTTIQPFITQDNMVFVVTDKKVHTRLMTTPQDTLAFLQQVKDGK